MLECKASDVLHLDLAVHPRVDQVGKVSATADDVEGRVKLLASRAGDGALGGGSALRDVLK